MAEQFSKKQLEYILYSVAHWNLAHGSVSSGKTFGTLFRFLQGIHNCPDSDIVMIGHTSTTIYQNAIRLIMESPYFEIFRPFCTWFPSKRELRFEDKIVSTIGAKDEGSIGLIQGRTVSLAYCDEMTLYPESIIDMIDTRLRKEYSQGFASMNPSHPNHKIKKWIDKAEEGDKNYYALHFTLDDNPYLDNDYKARVKNSLSGLFYKRNYLGLWVLAEGAIFDFFDRSIHVIRRQPHAPDYFICGIDYGTANAFACLLIGVSTGKFDQTGRRLWVEKEYYWDSKHHHRQKTNSEYAEEVIRLIEAYPIKAVYIDPSALAFKEELTRHGLHVVSANNDVEYGIQVVTTEMAKGNLLIMEECTQTIREIEGYVWDPNQAKKGYDEPLKKDDHTCDALRYAIATHKVPKFYEEEGFGRSLGYGRKSVF